MAYTEKQIQEGLQVILRSMEVFDDPCVVINDWRLLDQSNQDAPYAIIVTADTFDSRQDTRTATNNYDVPIVIAVRFSEWSTSLNELRDVRQAILDTFNTTGTSRAAGLSEGITIDRIYSASPITPYYDKFLSSEQQAVSDPVFVTQEIILEVRQF